MKAARCAPALCGGKPRDLAAGTASHRLNFLVARLNRTENLPNDRQSGECRFNTTGGKLERYRAGFNPVAAMRAESLIEDAVLIADALVVSGRADPHWDESAKTFIEGVIIEVATAKRFEGRRDLVTVRDLIAEGEALTRDGKTLTGFKVLEGFMRASSHRPSGKCRLMFWTSG